MRQYAKGEEDYGEWKWWLRCQCGGRTMEVGLDREQAGRQARPEQGCMAWMDGRRHDRLKSATRAATAPPRHRCGGVLSVLILPSHLPKYSHASHPFSRNQPFHHRQITAKLFWNPLLRPTSTNRRQPGAWAERAAPVLHPHTTPLDLDAPPPLKRSRCRK